MHSDPMGDAPGRILLNGNAESIERFVKLAHRTLGPSRHRDPAVREREAVLICTGAWGPTELNDAALRRGFARTGRGLRGRFVNNLGVYTAMMTFLAERDVVRTLYDEHEQVWWALFKAYTAENGATVARLRDAWQHASEKLPGVTMHELLHLGENLPPGPRTRPVSVFLKGAYAAAVGRAVQALQEADERHARTLSELWTHFHLAAGCEFDPLWQELRAGLVQRILDASCIVLPGGSPSRLLVGFRFFQLEGVLVEALRRGTSVFGTSAGAMAFGRRVVVFNDRANPREEFQLLENGLRVVEGLQIFPHCTDRVQTDDPANLAYLAARFRHRACVGLNQGSVLELTPAGGRWRARSIGEEDVVVFGPLGEKRRYGAGEEVPEIQGVP